MVLAIGPNALSGSLATAQAAGAEATLEEAGVPLSVESFVQETPDFIPFVVEQDELLAGKTKEAPTVAKGKQNLEILIQKRKPDLPTVWRYARELAPNLPALTGGLLGALGQPSWHNDISIGFVLGGGFAAFGFSSAGAIIQTLIGKYSNSGIKFWDR